MFLVNWQSPTHWAKIAALSHLLMTRILGDLHKFSLMCFGGPTSNGVSDQIFERLSSVIAPHFAWAAGFNGFLLSGETFGSGGDGVVLGYDSPWESRTLHSCDGRAWSSGNTGWCANADPVD